MGSGPFAARLSMTMEFGCQAACTTLKQNCIRVVRIYRLCKTREGLRFDTFFFSFRRIGDRHTQFLVGSETGSCWNESTHKDVLLEAEVPGLTKDDVSVEVKDNILAVSGERKVKRDDDAVYVRKELKRSSFKRSFSLGDNLDSERISAEFENGILTITIPKIKPVQVEARKVEIK